MSADTLIELLGTADMILAGKSSGLSRPSPATAGVTMSIVGERGSRVCRQRLSAVGS